MSGTEALALAFVVLGAVFVLRPLVGALAKRVAGDTAGVPSSEELAALRAELLDAVGHMRQEVGELAERVDFTERLLAKQREAERLAPPEH